ncbi:MAG: hypothetical protein ACOZIN_22845 [Myxococcota bacterium]
MTRLLLMLLFLAPPSLTYGATYYVDQAHPNANDANPGTSESAPWLTLARAMQSNVVAGDTIYVKNGTYDAGGAPFEPASSGMPGNPIAFRAYTPSSGARHVPLLTQPGGDPTGSNRPVISSSGRNYIIWDGFRLGPWTNAQVYGSTNNKATGNVFENLIIDRGASVPASCGNNNYAGIFVQLASFTTIRYNTIRNVTYTGCTALNATGMTLYDTDNTHVHNNEIYNVNTGISDKENGVSNIHELNYIHDVSYGPFVHFQGYVTSRCGVCPVQNNVVRYNVGVNAEMAVYHNLGDPSIQTNIDVHNNTFYNVRLGFAMFGAVPDIDYYNNIVVVSGLSTYAQIGLTNIPSDWMSNYNVHRALNGGSIRFRPPSGFETLAAWQARGPGYDPVTVLADPQFAGSPSNNARYYRPQAGSPALGAGRVGGTSSGAVVNIGAYATGSECVGLPSACGASSGAPSPPRGLWVR